MVTDELRRCPFCAEWIQSMAVVCRYCQRQVGPAPGGSAFQVDNRSNDEAAVALPQPKQPGPPPLAQLDPALRDRLEAHYRGLSDESLAEALALGPEGYRQPEIWRIVESAFEERSPAAVETAVPPPAAVSQPDAAPLTAPLEPAVMCVNHATASAIRRCRYCGAAVCETCTFSFPNELYLCPACATKPPVVLTAQRRNYLTWSYIGASVSTLTLVVLMVLGVSRGSRTAADNGALDTLGGWVAFASLATGLACGAMARPPRQPSPAVVRGAWIWNWILAAVWVLLMVIGLAKK